MTISRGDSTEIANSFRSSLIEMPQAWCGTSSTRFGLTLPSASYGNTIMRSPISLSTV